MYHSGIKKHFTKKLVLIAAHHKNNHFLLVVQVFTHHLLTFSLTNGWN